MSLDNKKNTQNATKPDWNIGYTTKNHLCLDFDNTTYFKVRSIIKLLMASYPDIGDCIILESSSPKQREYWSYPPNSPICKRRKAQNYHAVFNNFVTYERSCHIIETLAFLGVLNEEYVRIREMRNDMTLRVSKTVNVEYVKPKPVFLEYIQNHNCNTNGKGIYYYNQLRKAV